MSHRMRQCRPPPTRVKPYLSNEMWSVDREWPLPDRPCTLSLPHGTSPTSPVLREPGDSRIRLVTTFGKGRPVAEVSAVSGLVLGAARRRSRVACVHSPGLRAPGIARSPGAGCWRQMPQPTPAGRQLPWPFCAISSNGSWRRSTCTRLRPTCGQPCPANSICQNRELVPVSPVQHRERTASVAGRS